MPVFYSQHRHRTPDRVFSLSAIPARNSGITILTIAASGGRAAKGVGLRPGTFLDCWFQSHQAHGTLSLVTVVCFRVKVYASGWSPVQRSPTKWCVCVCVCVYHWLWSKETITFHTYREKVKEGRLSKKSKNSPSGTPWLNQSTTFPINHSIPSCHSTPHNLHNQKASVEIVKSQNDALWKLPTYSHTHAS